MCHGSSLVVCSPSVGRYMIDGKTRATSCPISAYSPPFVTWYIWGQSEYLHFIRSSTRLLHSICLVLVSWGDRGLYPIDASLNYVHSEPPKYGGGTCTNIAESFKAPNYIVCRDNVTVQAAACPQISLKAVRDLSACTRACILDKAKYFPHEPVNILQLRQLYSTGWRCNPTLSVSESLLLDQTAE